MLAPVKPLTSLPLSLLPHEEGDFNFPYLFSYDISILFRTIFVAVICNIFSFFMLFFLCEWIHAYIHCEEIERMSRSMKHQTTGDLRSRKEVRWKQPPYQHFFSLLAHLKYILLLLYIFTSLDLQLTILSSLLTACVHPRFLKLCGCPWAPSFTLCFFPFPLRPVVINTWFVTFGIIFLYSTASLDCLAQPWQAARLHHHRRHHTESTSKRIFSIFFFQFH